ncbi:MAG: hypothetical protein ABI740_02510, partial [Alphaproteobacteria bacterium]
MPVSIDTVTQPGSPAGPAIAGYSAHRIALTGIIAAASIFYLMIIMRGVVFVDGRAYFTLFDDAMISMRYAKTLASGGGLSWNPSDTPVEGFTNLLWTLWMAVLHLAPVPEGWASLLVSLSSAACLLAAAVGARKLALALGGSELTSCAALTVVAFYYPLAFWSLRGMETGALAALMVWAMVLALREQGAPNRARIAALCVMVIALILVREDAVVFVVVLGGYLGVTGLPKRRMSGVFVLVSAMTALGLLTGFRWIYFGDITPNTYTLKVTGVALDERLHRGVSVLFSPIMLRHFALIVIALALSVPGLRGWPRPKLLAASLPIVAFLAQAAYSAFVGGDVWESLGPNRFIVIAMPGLLAATLVWVASAITSTRGALGSPRVAGAFILTFASLIVAMTSAGPAYAAIRSAPAYVAEDRAATEAGLCLRGNTARDARIAVIWAGSMAYYADRFSIDLLGKMDRKIAASAPKRSFLPGHNKWDYAYSIETYRPDLILQVW